MSNRRVIVIGAGAAGTMAAIFAASAGADTLLLEGTEDGGRKILISGGGRCNILPMQMDESRYVTDSSTNTLRRILRSWPLAEQRRFLEDEVGIPLVDEPEWQKVFPASNKARDVRDGLLSLTTRRGAALRTDTRVLDVRPADGRWEVRTKGEAALHADAVILACGGLSVPNTGSDGSGLRIAEALGHTMHPTYAALTPLLAKPSLFTQLSGVSLTVTLTARSEKRQATSTGGFLFTHRGYSGPAVFDVSHVLVRSRAEGGAPASLQVKWTALGDAEWDAALRAQGTKTLLGAVRAEMPERLASTLISAANVDPTRSLAELRREERLRMIDTLVRCTLPWTGDEGYKKAEVGIGKRRTLRAPEAAGGMWTRRMGEVKNGRWGGFLGGAAVDFGFPGAPTVEPEGDGGQPPQL